MERQKVTFTANRAELIKLDRDSSKEVPGRNGPQWMRILDGDTRILFADADLENAIVQSGARKGDVVQIVKRSNGWEAGIMPDTAARKPQTYDTWAAGHATSVALREPQQPAQQTAQTPALKTSRAVELAAALETAIDAAMAAERYAASKGHPITFETQDIRAMANSIICRSEGGRS
jgi:hypothetical protein